MKTFSKIKSFALVALVAGLLMFVGSTSASAQHYGHSHGPYWHDTSHFDYHPGGFAPHGDHFHYVPGHYDWHQTGHYHW